MKILIIDDQKLFAESLAGILTSLGEGGVDEIRIAGSGEEALQAVTRFRPDLALLDIFMPGMGGLEALKLLREAQPSMKVLMLTTFGYENYVKEALGGGASGYLLKDTTPQEVWSAIAAVLAGQTVMSPAVVESLSGKPRSTGQRSVAPVWFPLLSEKEKKILLLISKGLSNEEIAERLHLGKNTIRNYVSAVYEKIDVKDRFSAIRVAIEAQIHTLVLE